ncbi:MAG: diguanylate cyclase [Pirellulaceae bacterium]|nr:diguanylate cyclase [Pirellulaceae bacterium]
MLLVEDDDADAVLFQRILLTCAGTHQAHVATSLAAALDWLDDHHCDIILLDLSLPDSFGLDGIGKIHQHNPSTPIVVLTGLDDNKTSLQSLDCGAQDYLVKDSLDARDLERTLRHAIQRQQIQNENRILLHELQLAARSDALTGVLNRHAMITEFERCWNESIDLDCPLSCVILDVDFFKRINDQLGHLAGDQVLRGVAQLINENTRPKDSIARYGGEEFCVILVDADEKCAAQWAERARATLARSPFDFANKSISVTASFGVAQRSRHTPTIESLIDAADQSLLAAKQSGRNRVVVASDIVIPERKNTPPVHVIANDPPTLFRSPIADQ